MVHLRLLTRKSQTCDCSHLIPCGALCIGRTSCEPFGALRRLIYVGRQREQAFAAFYAAHWPAIAGYCAGLTRSGHLGDEFAQEAFTRLYSRWGRPADPLSYTYRIAHNLVVDQHRRRAEEPVAEQAHSNQYDQFGLLDAVQRLPAGPREATLLHYYADLPVNQVAKVLRRPAGTVKRHLHEARKLLAAALTETP
jgi:RNA polymerase sigma-70 factor (ECF subfamily)